MRATMLLCATGAASRAHKLVTASVACPELEIRSSGHIRHNGGLPVIPQPGA
jgi:hypothetical protein